MNHRTDNIIKLTKADAKAAAATMAHAFQDYPVAVFFMPDAEKRRKLNPRIYRLVIGSSVVHYEVYSVSQAMEGVALWQSVDKKQKPRKRGFSLAWLWLGLFMDRKSGKRQRAFFKYSTRVRDKYLPERYWYLQMLGVDPAHQGKGYAGRLLRPMLARADKEGLPVFLETQLEKNVSLYQHFGFKVVEEGVIPETDIYSWAMVKDKNGSEGT